MISEEKTAIGSWFKIKALFKYGVTDWSIYKPVSYTHLDVYKRQDVECQLLYVMGDMEADIRTHHIHIVKWKDVYKRQAVYIFGWYRIVGVYRE